MATTKIKETAESLFTGKGISEKTAEKLANVVETTAKRRGRSDTQDQLSIVCNPGTHLSDGICVADILNQPPVSNPVPPPENIIAPPKPPEPIPQPTPAPKPNPFVTIGNTKFYSESDFLAQKKIQSPCGDYAPFAKEENGQQRSFCTLKEFLAAGYSDKYFETGLDPNTRGSRCPKGQTFWGGKCKTISFSEAQFL